MRKYTIIGMVLAALSFSSCKDFLDVKPTNSADAATAVQTPNDAQVIMNGLMRGLTSINIYGRNLYLYADVKGGDLTIFSQGRGQDALYTFNHSASSGSYSGFWDSMYATIFQVNSLLENIERLEAEGTTENF